MKLIIIFTITLLNTSILVADDKELFNKYKQTCDNLAYSYYAEESVKQEYIKASKYFKIACSSGKSISCYSLGYMYQNAEGVK